MRPSGKHFFTFYSLCLHGFIVPVIMLLALHPTSNVSFCLDWSDALQRPLVLSPNFEKLTHVMLQLEPKGGL